MAKRTIQPSMAREFAYNSSHMEHGSFEGIAAMHKDRILLFVAAVFATLLAGCVERQLTIVTEPPGAMVALNDEQIGVSPVTVSFNWYGDYWVRLSKDGYQTLDTHRELKGPWYDHFPFDFVVQIADPTRVVDTYEWTFELEPKQYPTREELIDQARALRTQTE